MKKVGLALTAAGMLLVAVSAPAFAVGGEQFAVYETKVVTIFTQNAQDDRGLIIKDHADFTVSDIEIDNKNVEVGLTHFSSKSFSQIDHIPAVVELMKADHIP